MDVHIYLNFKDWAFYIYAICHVNYTSIKKEKRNVFKGTLVPLFSPFPTLESLTLAPTSQGLTAQSAPCAGSCPSPLHSGDPSHTPLPLPTTVAGTWPGTRWAFLSTLLWHKMKIHQTSSWKFPKAVWITINVINSFLKLSKSSYLAIL